MPKDVEHPIEVPYVMKYCTFTIINYWVETICKNQRKLYDKLNRIEKALIPMGHIEE